MGAFWLWFIRPLAEILGVLFAWFVVIGIPYMFITGRLWRKKK